MDYVSLTLNLVCMGFLIFLFIIYFSKKTINNNDNMLYRYILFCSFFKILFEIFYILAVYLCPKSLFLIGVLKRTTFYFLLLFFLTIASYTILIAVEKNKKWNDKLKEKQDIIFYIILIGIFLAGYFQYTMPLNFYFYPNGYVYYVDGPASNDLALIVAGILLSVAGPILVINWKTTDKKKILPIFIILILEVITLIVNGITLSLCLASFSLTITSYLMYFTIENPDIKVIAQLEYSKNQAEKSNKAKSDFLSSMSHEIKTPLNAIVGLSQVIEKSDDLDSVHSDAKEIIVASQKLESIVNSILDASKIEANEIDLLEEPYNLKNIVDNLVQIMTIRIENKPVEIKTEFSNNIPDQLIGDSEKVKQILTNLLTNAVKYTDKGFINIKIDSENKNNKAILTIYVKDTGRGIKENQIQYLFDKFYRAEEDKDGTIEGTGLGLSITKSLVDLLDGEINVESKYGEGSTFIVKIIQKIDKIKPLDEQIKEDNVIDVHESETKTEEKEEVQKEIESIPEKIETSKVEVSTPEIKEPEIKEETKKATEVTVTAQKPIEEENKVNHDNILLVVDDNKVNLKIATRMLEDLKYDVDIAHSGIECLEKIQENKEKYDLIFMDIMMPEMNGVDTMKKLKEMDGFKVPIIALTADSMDGSREKYLAVGFDEYISKPIIKQVLEDVLGKYVDIKDINMLDKEN